MVGQAVHDVEPSTSVYVSAAQTVHAAPETEAFPITHGVHVVPDDLSEPAGHG
jgi:hypothetical protein